MNEENLISDALEASKAALAYIQDSPDYKTLKAEYDNAAARRRDKQMRLAIIGDFSCGKSTFLNALFRRDILARDLRPTTAVPTWISWDRNDDDDVAVYFRGGDGSVRDLINGDKKENETFLGKSLPEALGPLIEAVTTDNSLREKVTDVYVSLPAAAGRKNLCLIDTPGVNAGDEAAREHINITRAVLKDSADAAIILFPANTGGLSHSFLDFLSEYDTRLLQNSIFVLTKYDRVATERDRRDLPVFVSGHVERISGYKPPVYTVSALSALRYCLGEAPDDPDARAWAERFERDMDEIIGGLGARRDAIVRGKLRVLAAGLTERLRSEMASAVKRIERERELLDESSPENLDASMKTITERALSDLAKNADTKKKDTTNDLANCYDKTLRTVKQKLNATTTRRKLNKCLDDSVRPEIRKLNKKLKSISSHMDSGFSEIFERYKAEILKCCSGYCEKLHIADSFSGSDPGIVPLSETEPLGVENLADVSQTLGALVMDAGFLLDDVLDFDVAEFFSDFLGLVANLTINLMDLFTPFENLKADAVAQLETKIKNGQRISLNNANDYIDKEWRSCGRLIEGLPGDLKKRYAEEFKAAEERFRSSEKILRERAEGMKRTKEMLDTVSAMLQEEKIPV